MSAYSFFQEKATLLKLIILLLLFSFSEMKLSGQEVWNFHYTGSSQTIQLSPGKYKLEVWGAQGGFQHPDAKGGKGGYSVGELEITENQIFEIFVGEAGESQGEGAFNGGGAAGSNYGAEGGGGTDIRIAPFELDNRIIVAGGGGGATFGTFPASGGFGGGNTAGNGAGADGYTGGSGGSQNSGGPAGCCYSNTASGTFGEGAGPGSYHNAGGGGGWYGGGSGSAHAGAGGGSSYVGNLQNGQALSGSDFIPAPQNTDSLIEGNPGHGFARITKIFEIAETILIDATCHDTNDGSISVTLSGGTPPFNFAWSHGVVSSGLERTSEVSNLKSGPYTVTVTDASGDTLHANFNLDPSQIQVEIEVTETPQCEENSVGSAMAFVTGGNQPYTYAWSSGEDSPAITDKNPGIYSLTVVDAHNCASQETSVEILPEDSIAPIALTQNSIAYLDSSGYTSISVSDVDNGSSDDCLIDNMTLDKTEFTCADAFSGGVSVVLSLRDIAGNTVESQAEIEVLDTLKPRIATNNITVELDENGLVFVDAENFDIGTTDNCGIESINLSQSAFDCSHLGVNQLTFSAVDYHGNEKNQEVLLRIIDRIAPTISGPDTLIFCSNEPIDYRDIGVSDNCTARTRQTSGPVEGSILEEGEYSAEFVAYDPSGNYSHHELKVIVRSSPVVELGKDLVVEKGETVSLSAGKITENRYLWSTGDTKPEISIAPERDLNISVDVHNSAGCHESDRVLIKVLETDLSDQKSENFSLKIFPNPTAHFLNVDLRWIDTMKRLQINILDLNGKMVMQKTIRNLSKTVPLKIDLSDLAKGAYLVNINSDVLSLTERLVKQ